MEKSSIEGSGCPHYGICGGCSYQALTYEAELRYKEGQIIKLFEKAGLDINYLGIEGSPLVHGYRNKMEYTFGDERRMDHLL